MSSAADSVDAKLRKDKNVALYNSMRDYIVLSGLDSTELTVGNRKLVMVVPTEASVLPYTTPLSPFEVTKFGDSPARTEASAVLDVSNLSKNKKKNGIIIHKSICTFNTILYSDV